MLCVKCNYDNPADALFCMKCGTKVENRCSSCNTVNLAEANFCRKCRGTLGESPPAPWPSPTAAAKTSRVEVTHERQTAEGLDGERAALMTQGEAITSFRFRMLFRVKPLIDEDRTF